MKDLEFDIVVVGAGPAGLTAAIYARRANLTVAFIDRDAPGGKVVTTAVVENYPGFKSIRGAELCLEMYDQAVEAGSKFIFGNVINIDTKKDKYKYVELEDNRVLKAKAVIIATGMVNRKLGIPNEEEFFNNGISYCAICDGAIFKGKPVAVIGSGRSAVDESIYLSDICSHVTVISNKPQFKAEQVSIDRLNERKNVTVLYNTDTLSFNGDKKLESITVKDKDTQKEYEVKVDGAFIFIGILPVSPLVDNATITDPELKFIKVDHDMKIGIEGLFSAGDINVKHYRQISTAIGDGGVAALAAVDYISSNKW